MVDRLRRVALLLLVMGVLGAVGAEVVLRVYRGRAVLAQRVTLPDPDVADLFGSEPTPLGSPQLYVLQGSEALVPGSGKDGKPALLDQGVLDRTGQYPLQLKTVEFVARAVQIASALDLVTAWVLLLVLSRRLAAQVE